MASPIVMGIVSSFHDIFSAIWIGGLIIMAFIVIPIMKRQMLGKQKQDTPMQKSQNEKQSSMGNGFPQKANSLVLFQQKLQIWVWISMVALLITGILLKKSNSMAPQPVSATYTTLLLIKHIAYGIMIGIGILRSMTFRISLKRPSSNLQKLSVILVYVNVVLGIVTVFLSGIMPRYKFTP